MGYVGQSDIQPIIAKEYAVAHWNDYKVADTKEDFIALLNILQACGENLDTLHDVCLNGETEFCDMYRESGWSSDREVADTLMDLYCTFYREKDFIDFVLEMRENYDDMDEYVEDMRLEATDDIEGNNDVQITKTEDGYVRRVWY